MGDADLRIGRLAAGQHSLVTHSQLLGAGLPRLRSTIASADGHSCWYTGACTCSLAYARRTKAT